MKGIKNILFDLGGVLIDLDRSKSVDAFKKLGFDNIDDFLGDYGQKGPFLALEEGKFTEAEFYNAVREHIPNASDKEIADAFMQFLQGLPVEKLKMVRNLKEKGYRTMMLSNTNPVMFGPICETYFKQEGLDINAYFDDIFLSYELGCIKPDEKIYKRLIEKSGINPSETLFIDDSKANLDTAVTIGFETFLAPQYSDFSHIFEEK